MRGMPVRTLLLTLLLALLCVFPLSAQETTDEPVAPNAVDALPMRLTYYSSDYVAQVPPGWIYTNEQGIITLFESVAAFETVRAGAPAVPSFIILTPTSPLNIEMRGTPEAVVATVADALSTAMGVEFAGDIVQVTHGWRTAYEMVAEDSELRLVLGALETTGNPIVYVFGTLPGDDENIAVMDSVVASLQTYGAWLDTQDGDPNRLAQQLFYISGTGAVRVAAPAAWVAREIFFGNGVATWSLISDTSAARALRVGGELPAGMIALSIVKPTARMQINGELVDYAAMPLEEALPALSYIVVEPPPGLETMALDADFPAAAALRIDGAIVAIMGEIEGQRYIVRHSVRDTPLDQATVDMILRMLPTVRIEDVSPQN